MPYTGPPPRLCEEAPLLLSMTCPFPLPFSVPLPVLHPTSSYSPFKTPINIPTSEKPPPTVCHPFPPLGGGEVLPFLHPESYLYGPASPTSSVFLPWPTQSDVSFHCDLVHTRTCLNNSRSFTNSTSSDHALCCVLLLHSVAPRTKTRLVLTASSVAGPGEPRRSVPCLFAGSARCGDSVGVSFMPSIPPGIPPSPPVPALPVGVQAVGSGVAPPAGTVHVVSQSRPL